MTRDGERHIPFPVCVDGRHRATLRSLAPDVGAHTAEILRDIGISAPDAEALRRSGIFGGPGENVGSKGEKT